MSVDSLPKWKIVRLVEYNQPHSYIESSPDVYYPNRATYYVHDDGEHEPASVYGDYADLDPCRDHCLALAMRRSLVGLRARM